MGPPPAPKPAPKPPAAAPGAIPSNSPLLQPSQQLSGQPLLNSAQQLANVQTQGPLTQLAKQIAQNQAQGAAAQKQTFGYYMTLAKQAQDSLNQEQAIGSGLNSQLSQIGQDTGNAIGGFGQQAQSGALGRMAGMGLDAGQSQALWNETARQNQIGSQNAGAFRSAGATQGANYSGAAAANKGTFALRGQERLGDIGRATQLANVPLSTKQATLIASKGALTSTALGQLRSQERNFQVAQQGLGIKAANITAANSRNAATIAGANARNTATNATSAQNNAANNATSRANNQLTNQTSAQNNAANNATRIAIQQATQGAKQGKPASGAAANRIFAGIDNLTGLLQRLISQGISPVDAYHKIQMGGPIYDKKTGKVLFQVPRNTLGDSVLNAAYNVRPGGGGLSPGDVAWFRSVGIFNPTRYGPYNTTGSNISQGGLQSPH